MSVEEEKPRQQYLDYQDRLAELRPLCSDLFLRLVAGKEEGVREGVRGLIVREEHQISELAADILQELQDAPERRMEMYSMWKVVHNTKYLSGEQKERFDDAKHELFEVMNHGRKNSVFAKERDGESAYFFIKPHAEIALYEDGEGDEKKSFVEISMKYELNAFEARLIEVLTAKPKQSKQELIEGVFGKASLSDDETEVATAGFWFLVRLLNRGLGNSVMMKDGEKKWLVAPGVRLELQKDV